MNHRGLPVDKGLAEGKHYEQLAQPETVLRLGRARALVGCFYAFSEAPTQEPVVVVAQVDLELVKEMLGVWVGRQVDGDVGL